MSVTCPEKDINNMLNANNVDIYSYGLGLQEKLRGQRRLLNSQTCLLSKILQSLIIIIILKPLHFLK